MTAWEIKAIRAISRKLDEACADGWEPFAVTDDQGLPKVWLRRQVEKSGE